MRMLAGIMVAAVLVTVAAGQSTQTTPSNNAAQGRPAPQQAPAVNNATAAAPVIPGYSVTDTSTNKGEARISKEVRHELAMLPYYTLFDDLRYRVNGYTVELLGNVVNPSLKGDAEKAVKDIEGVEQVVNHINILPPSPMDDRIRQQVARAVFNADGLSRYAWEAAPSIHIVVNNGHVTLTGVVDNSGDKTLAGMRANQVPGIFSVQNDLLVAKGS
jgi:hyperosmotically inducible periplasmic protein